MTTPNMEGYKGVVPYDNLKILDTTDERGFNLGVVEPEGSIANYDAWWWNFGYAYLYDGQLSLVSHPTLDAGTDVDTINVMNIGAPFGGDWLNHGIIATPANTSGWTYPMQDPFRPFLDKFAGGIKWDPPAGAATGIIRKAFQWDGSYYPDTWDFIYYPIANGYTPDSSYLADPMTLTLSYALGTIEVDGACSTGYRLTLSGGPMPYAVISYKHYQTDDPWFDSVNNATGYVIELEFKSGATTPPSIITVKDGSYQYEFLITPTQVLFLSGTVGAGSYIYNTITAYSIISIRVIGTAITVYIDGILRITETLNSASGVKLLELGSHGEVGNLLFYIDHLKYFLNGNTPPIY